MFIMINNTSANHNGQTKERREAAQQPNYLARRLGVLALALTSVGIVGHDIHNAFAGERDVIVVESGGDASRNWENRRDVVNSLREKGADISDLRQLTDTPDDLTVAGYKVEERRGVTGEVIDKILPPAVEPISSVELQEYNHQLLDQEANNASSSQHSAGPRQN
jgi:hypothetical protein